jgi:GDP-L-fucose synthase
MNKNIKIFVAGHRGMVGSAIMRRLSACGYGNIVTRDRAALDLLDQRAVNEFFASERPEAVFLAAAKVGGIMANTTNKAAFLYENLQIQNNVMHAAADSGVARFVFISSSCIYPREAPQPIKEKYFMTGPLEPTNEGYAIAKIAGLKLCKYLTDADVWRGTNVIPCNLYGIGDNFDPVNSHVMAALVRRFVEAADSGAESVTCWGTGSARREFLHVDDLARGTVMLFENDPYRGELVNVGSGSDVTIRELAALVAEKSGFSGRIEGDASKPDGIMRRLMDTERARGIGFEPEITLERGVENLIAIFRENTAREDQSE